MLTKSKLIESNTFEQMILDAATKPGSNLAFAPWTYLPSAEIEFRRCHGQALAA